MFFFFLNTIKVDENKNKSKQGLGSSEGRRGMVGSIATSFLATKKKEEGGQGKSKKLGERTNERMNEQ